MKKRTQCNLQKLARITIGCTLASAMLLNATACGTTDESESTPTSTSTETTSTSQEKSFSGTITFLGEAMNIATVTAAMEEYQKIHPDVNLETIVVKDESEFETTMTAKIGAKDLPDIISMQVKSTIGDYAENGYLQPITDLGIQDTLIAGDTSLLEYNDEIYGIPMNFSCSGVFANMEAIEDLGVSMDTPPYSLPEFIALCEELQAAGMESPIVVAAKEESPSTAFVFQSIYQNVYGADPNWYANVLRGEDAWNGDLFQQVFEDYATLVPYMNADMLGMDKTGAIKSFVTNESAFLIDSSGVIVSLRSVAPELEISMLSPPFAADSADMSAVTNFDNAITISSQANDPELCRDFVSFLFSKEIYSIAATAGKMSPTIQGANVVTDPAFDALNAELSNGMPSSAMLSRQWIPGVKEVMKKGSQDFLAGVDYLEICDNIEAEHQRLMEANPDYVTNFLENYIDQ